MFEKVIFWLILVKLQCWVCIAVHSIDGVANDKDNGEDGEADPGNEPHGPPPGCPGIR